MKGQKGFTLIELMIVVAVIGLLSAIALPKYQNFAKKGAVASGVATLSALKTNIEDFMANNGSFPSTLADAGAVSSSIGTLGLSTSSAIFTFTTGAASGAKVAIHRSTDGGWKCKYGVTPITESIDISGCAYKTDPTTL